MLFFFIVSKSRDFLAEKKHLLQTKYSVPEDRIFQFLYDPLADKYERKGGNKEKKQEEYDRLFNLINAKLQEKDPVHNRFIGITDCTDPDSNATNAWNLHALLEVPGMLILSFPEIQWLPVYLGGQIGSRTMDLDTAIELCQGGYTPLFDGDGLRGILLSRARRGPNAKDIRRDVVFAIDEESHFAFMNTYTAFRFGYRGFPVMTQRCAEQLLVSRKKGKSSGGNSSSRDSGQLRRNIPCAVDFDNPDKKTEPLVNSVVVFEDICLNFPDASISYAENVIPFGIKRDHEFPMIPEADLRVIATATPRKERVADVGEDRKVTLNEFFGKYRFNYRSVACHSKKWSKQVASSIKNSYRLFCRSFFNRTGGWWGYGLINALELGISILALSYVFLTKRFLLFSLILLFIYLWFSTREWFSQRIIRYISRNGSPGRSFFFKRLQWPFMPKYYISHDPISYEKAGPGIRYWEEAHKPLAGIFDFRNNCGLPNGTGVRGIYSISDVKQFYRNAIRKGVFSEAEDQEGPDNHASRGAVLDIAMRLIRRAEQMNNSIVDVEGAVHAAVLADVAMEMLDHKTPAASMEALQWKHYYEILAECEFVGVRARLNIEDRYVDIHNAMGRICRINRRIVRKEVFISGMAEIIDKLAALLWSKGKLEEATFFTAHSRRLHRKLLFTPVRAFLAYPEWALRNKWNFLISFGCSCAVFFLFWKIARPASFYDSLIVTSKVMLARIEVEIPPQDKTLSMVVTLARQVAVLHLCFVAARFLMFMERK